MRALALEMKAESLWTTVKITEILKQIIQRVDSAVCVLSLHNSNISEHMTDVAVLQIFCKLCYDIIIPTYWTYLDISPIFSPKFCQEQQQYQTQLDDKSVFLLGPSAVSHSTALPANNLSGPRFFGLYLQTVYKSPITRILRCLRREHEMFL